MKDNQPHSSPDDDSFVDENGRSKTIKQNQTTAQPAKSFGSHLAKLRNTDGLGPSTLSIIHEAERRGIPWRRMDDQSKILLGYGKHQKMIRATMTANTSCIGVETADNKYETKKLLANSRIPVPEGAVCTTIEEMLNQLEKVGYPVVIKPLDGNHGRGVSTNISSIEAAKTAFLYAQTFSAEIVLEKFIEGHDHRLLLVDGKLVAAARRVPAHVTGDGKSTVRELIEEINRQPERGDGHEHILTKISIDDHTINQLKSIDYTLETIPASGETVFLKAAANLSSGGIAVDVTEHVHPENTFMFERIAAIMGLDLCGIDVVATDLKTPLAKNGGAVIEVNAAPGFRMHLAPSVGKPRNVAAAVVDMLFPPPAVSRIPIFAITGTNGKTTTTRLLAHIAQSCGKITGYTTTDGIYIGGHKIESGDCSGPASATTILADPLVDFAVLETARGGMLRAGLAFDYCDVGILTNIAADHLGLNNINTLEDLAEVKATVVRSVKKSGWAILNGEDFHCNSIAKTLECNVGLFSLNNNEEAVLKHIENGGLAATVHDGHLIIHHEKSRTFIANVKDIPLTLGGKSKCMTANILAATAAAFAYGFTAKQIESALRSFVPGPELTPGRMNHFKVRDFSVLVDYAHNPHGMFALQDYLSHITAARKIGIIAGVGDRRDNDIIELAEIAGNIFDYIIVRQEHSLRGRELSEMNSLMVRGIEKAGRKVEYELIPDEKEAIRRALNLAKSGELIVALSDNFQDVIGIIEEFQLSHA